MNGIHDMGGMDGFGPVEPEPNEPVFHADYEKRVFAVSLASAFLIPYFDDVHRFAIERVPAERYLSEGYYPRWLKGLEDVLVARGLVTRAELEGADPAPGPAGLAGPSAAEIIPAITHGLSSRDPASPLAPSFAVGSIVRARMIHPAGHTRLPRYVRGQTGEVTAVHGVFGFADARSAGADQPQPLYTVRFAARTLWGDEAPAGDCVLLDLWEAYLEAA